MPGVIRRAGIIKRAAPHTHGAPVPLRGLPLHLQLEHATAHVDYAGLDPEAIHDALHSAPPGDPCAGRHLALVGR